MLTCVALRCSMLCDTLMPACDIFATAATAVTRPSVPTTLRWMWTANPRPSASSTHQVSQPEGGHAVGCPRHVGAKMLAAAHTCRVVERRERECKAPLLA